MDPLPSLWEHCCFVHFMLHLNMENVSFQMETKPLRIISRQSAGCLFPGKSKEQTVQDCLKGIDLCSSGTFRISAPDSHVGILDVGGSCRKDTGIKDRSSKWGYMLLKFIKSEDNELHSK
ncbi:hypothetical protein CEXT_417741 [Caerostris extrusa]|uniref:Uncharacterized protein n=1 Tax=Caerostris extrusa TaxID=172846 RepID=A0AAV4R567_CAEEX|nr:hypothetical protein CEXT_417741 [Caerostris extrusa]